MKTSLTNIPIDLFQLENFKFNFLKFILKTNNCWIWKGAKDLNGYGRLRVKKKLKRASRVSYELFKGEIPKGLVIDHLCKNPSCVNPEHLEVVTQAENVLRGNGITSINSKKTHCPKRHEYTSENTYLTPQDKRICKKCKEINQILFLKNNPNYFKNYYHRNK